LKINLNRAKTDLLSPLRKVFLGVFKLLVPDVGINAGGSQIIATAGPSNSIAAFFFLPFPDFVI
jgi:hypothetical protein